MGHGVVAHLRVTDLAGAGFVVGIIAATVFGLWREHYRDRGPPDS